MNLQTERNVSLSYSVVFGFVMTVNLMTSDHGYDLMSRQAVKLNAKQTITKWCTSILIPPMPNQYVL